MRVRCNNEGHDGLGFRGLGLEGFSLGVRVLGFRVYGMACVWGGGFGVCAGCSQCMRLSM